ncbi:MAG: hypothetical protein ACLVJ6_09080 [Merdibacter sp.]
MDTLELSMFDIDVHLAMEWFVSEQVDIVVLETGLEVVGCDYLCPTAVSSQYRA